MHFHRALTSEHSFIGVLHQNGSNVLNPGQSIALFDTLAKPYLRAYDDISTEAAYVHLTGAALPKHKAQLRRFTISSWVSKKPSHLFSFDRFCGWISCSPGGHGCLNGSFPYMDAIVGIFICRSGVGWRFLCIASAHSICQYYGIYPIGWNKIPIYFPISSPNCFLRIYNCLKWKRGNEIEILRYE